MSRKKKIKTQHDEEPHGAPKESAEADETITTPEAMPPEPTVPLDTQDPPPLWRRGPAPGPLGAAPEALLPPARPLIPCPIPPPPPPPWNPAPREFKLMKEDARWWSLNDYGAVVGAMRKTGAKRVLEFGPGNSTLALIEGGAESIDTCEHVEDWARVWDERLVKRFPRVVRLHRYSWPKSAPLSIPAVDGQRFDLTLIDGPETERRPDVVRYALARSTWVLVPTEELTAKPSKTWPGMRAILQEIADEADRSLEFVETGPLSGAFALIGPAGA